MDYRLVVYVGTFVAFIFGMTQIMLVTRFNTVIGIPDMIFSVMESAVVRRNYVPHGYIITLCVIDQGSGWISVCTSHGNGSKVMSKGTGSHTLLVHDVGNQPWRHGNDTYTQTLSHVVTPFATL